MLICTQRRKSEIECVNFSSWSYIVKTLNANGSSESASNIKTSGNYDFSVQIIVNLIWILVDFEFGIKMNVSSRLYAQLTYGRKFHFKFWSDKHVNCNSLLAQFGSYFLKDLVIGAHLRNLTFVFIFDNLIGKFFVDRGENHGPSSFGFKNLLNGFSKYFQVMWRVLKFLGIFSVAVFCESF